MTLRSKNRLEDTREETTKPSKKDLRQGQNTEKYLKKAKEDRAYAIWNAVDNIEFPSEPRKELAAWCL